MPYIYLIYQGFQEERQRKCLWFPAHFNLLEVISNLVCAIFPLFVQFILETVSGFYTNHLFWLAIPSVDNSMTMGEEMLVNDLVCHWLQQLSGVSSCICLHIYLFTQLFAYSFMCVSLSVDWQIDVQDRTWSQGDIILAQCPSIGKFGWETTP